MEEKIDWEKAEQMDVENSRFFSPETGREYLMSFKDFALVKKEMPDYNDKNKTVMQPVLNLTLDMLDSRPSSKEWGVVGATLRNKFKDYCENGLIKTQIFKFKKTEKGGKKDYTLSVMGPKAGHETIAPAVVQA